VYLPGRPDILGSRSGKVPHPKTENDMTVMTLDQLTSIVNNILGRTDLLIETADEDDSELLVNIPKAEAKGMTQDRWQAIYNDLSEATEAPIHFDRTEDGVGIYLGLRVNYNLHQDGTHLDFI
jgi:hypothetical protein